MVKGRRTVRGPAGVASAVRKRRCFGALPALLLICAVVVPIALASNTNRAEAAVPTLPEGFRDTIALDGLTQPTAVRFAPDGQIFVAEKSGIIKRFTSLGDRNPIVVANLSGAVDDIIDRGLESLAIDPGWSAGRRYLYVTYSLDAAIGEQPPRWNDSCPNPPGIDDDGCVIGGRLSRLTIGPDGRMTAEQVMIEDWCQQYHSHSLGDIQFGPEGAMYVSGGDGASYTFVDYGQAGDPPNPCGDPPTGYGKRNFGKSAEGGALRSQDLETTGDPTTLDGSIIRIDPNTAAPWPQNANQVAGIGDTNAKRIIAYGVRNPFRMAFRPGTNELWFGEVGWNTWEEVNRLASPNTSPANFGWPCYEGNNRQPGYDTAGLTLCEQLYAKGTDVKPAFTYAHGNRAVLGDTCSTTTGSSPTGIAFVANANWPAQYQGGLIWADYARSCLYLMPAGVNGQPDPTKVQMFEGNSANPVDLQVGPGSDLFYCDIVHGAVHRISYGTDPVVGGVTLDTWAGRPGGRLSDIPTGTPSSASSVVTNLEAPATGNAHGSRMRARLTPPATGDYTFWIASDGDADLYLSSDTNPANRRSIATVRNGVAPGAWDSQTNQRSAPVPLVGGATYFVETFAKHPSTADHVAIAWSSATLARQVVPSNVLAATAVGCAGWCPDATGSPPRLPVPTITAPVTPTAWAVGDTLPFAGQAADPAAGAMAASTLKWKLIMHHCTAGASCHVHQVQAFDGVSNGSFDAPNHDWPSYLELVLTATNAEGFSGTTSIQLDPRPVDVTFTTTPPGLAISIGSSSYTSPVTLTLIAGSRNSVAVPATATNASGSFRFDRWSDGGDRAHDIDAPRSGSLVLTASYNADGPGSPWVTPAQGSVRVADTRKGLGGTTLAAGQERYFKVTGVGGIPASGIVAVALTLTGTNPTTQTFLSAWPGDQQRPFTSLLNLAAGTTDANSAVLGVDASGRIGIYNRAGTTDIVLDVTGWYTSSAEFVAINPVRVVDTRLNVGGVRLGPGESRTLTVTGAGGVPANGAKAVALNLTATEATADAYLSIWPAGASRPAASVLNMNPGRTDANALVIGVDVNGRIEVYNSAGTTEVIVDVIGWYTGAATIRPIAPSRVVDTRFGTGGPTIGAGETRTFNLAGPGRATIPLGARGVVANITATNPTAATYLAIWPTGVADPNTSVLNLTPGRTDANALLLAVDAAGQVTLHNQAGTSDIIIDVLAVLT